MMFMIHAGLAYLGISMMLAHNKISVRVSLIRYTVGGAVFYYSIKKVLVVLWT